MTSLNMPHNCNRNDELLFSCDDDDDVLLRFVVVVVDVDVGSPPSPSLTLARNNASRPSSISLARPNLVRIDSDDDDDDAPFDSCEEDVKAGVPPPISSG